jgi:hypothetical protein
VLLLGGPVAGIFLLMFRKAPKGNEPDHQLRRLSRMLLGRYFLMLCGGLLLGVFVTGAQRFPERWLEPFMLLLPLYLFCHLANREVSTRSLRRYALILLAVALILPAFQMKKFWPPPKHSDQDPIYYSFAEPAKHLRQETTPQTVLFAVEANLAGNLRPYLPEVCCISSEVRCFTPPQAAKGRLYILLWNTIWGEDLSQHTLALAQQHLRKTLRLEGKVFYVQAPPLVPNERGHPIRMGCVIAYPDDAPGSRASAGNAGAPGDLPGHR